MTPTTSTLTAAALTACVVALPAHADYRYQYIGNPFTVANSEAVSYVDPDTGIPGYNFINYDSESSVTAVLYTHSLLTAGSNLSDVFRFTLTRTDGVIQSVLDFPYPYSGPIDPAAAPGTPANPINEGTFGITAVDASGLPTDWNIAIHFSYRTPTAREFALTFATATASDSVFGGYEGFTSFSGASTSNPGQWSVSAVPEPATVSLLVAGLALVGVMARKRSAPT